MWLVKRLNNKSITLTTYVLLTDFAPKCSCCEHELASLYTSFRKSAHAILISERRTPHQTFHWTWTTGSPSREELWSNFLWYCRSSIGLPWIKAVFHCVLMSFACRPRRLTSSQHKTDNHWPLHTPPPPLLSVFLSFSTLLFICPFMRYLELRHMLHCIISVITTISNWCHPNFIVYCQIL